MDFGNVLRFALLEQLENAVAQNDETIKRRILRDCSDPFQLVERDFRKHFRLDRDSARYLTESLRPHLQQGRRTTAVPLEIKVLGVLVFFASGSYQRVVGQALEQSRFSRVLTEVTDAMVEHLLLTLVKFPQTEGERNAMEEVFYEEYKFPGTIGAIDCTHIAIIAPNMEHPVRPGIAYYNRKGFYSMNVQVHQQLVSPKHSQVGRRAHCKTNIFDKDGCEHLKTESFKT